MKYVRVTVHDRDTYPLLAEHGLDIQPNSATNIAIERVTFYLIQQNLSNLPTNCFGINFDKI